MYEDYSEHSLVEIIFCSFFLSFLLARAEAKSRNIYSAELAFSAALIGVALAFAFTSVYFGWVYVLTMSICFTWVFVRKFDE